MAESKYTELMPEIIKMQLEGKTTGETAEIINKNKPGFGATESSVRGAIKRFYDKENENEKEQTDITKTLPQNKEGVLQQEASNEEKIPEKQEVINTEEVEKFISDKVQMGMAVEEFYQIKKKLGEASAIFSILNNEFGIAAEKLSERAKEKSPYLMYAGIWLLSLLFIGLSGYYIGHCFYKNALLFGMNLLGIPAGFIIGLAIGLAKNKKKVAK